LDANELARNKFNALFAAHDAASEPATRERKSAPRASKKQAKKTVKSN
jgi:hypothetical protein